MLSIDYLPDSLAMQISTYKNKEGSCCFSRIDLKYAYSQIPLDESIAKPCTAIYLSKATGTYRVVNRFYGLTDMPALQNSVDKILEGCEKYFAFLDNILIATKGKVSEHEEASDEILLKKLDREGLAISVQKCKFAKQTIEWFGFKLTPHGVTPLIFKTEALQKLDPPKTLKQLRSSMGSIRYLIKFIPNLAEIWEPL